MKLLQLLLIAFSLNGFAQPPKYSCQHPGNKVLAKLIGTWKVSTKDRTSPGNYEHNSGVSVISSGLNGCSIQESYKGVFKENFYAVEASMFMKDSLQLQRVYYDSEHSNVMVFDGDIEVDGFELYWVRDPAKKKMQVRFNLVILNSDEFEWSTSLSTDYGETWQLTHRWQYSRVTPFDSDNKDHNVLKQTISDYHFGLSKNDSQLVLSALGDQFIMWNGNFSANPINWEAHMSLSDDDLKEWPKRFVEQAGPYENQFDLLSVNIRGNAAVVITRDTGKNKFRAWDNEQTTWLLGKKGNEWRILGYYLQNISNP